MWTSSKPPFAVSNSMVGLAHHASWEAWKARRQTELAEELGMEPYVMSRPLTKLEHDRYLKRGREGKDKTVTINDYK
jgi:DNA-binding MarR family transcriptional regulator